MDCLDGAFVERARATLHLSRSAAGMKRILRRFRDKLSAKDLPPPYQENENVADGHGRFDDAIALESAPVCEVLDLLANCKITSEANDSQPSDAEYAEIPDMGLWHSLPLAHRHKSKISLTWVLKENLENTKLPEKPKHKDERLTNIAYTPKHTHNKKISEDAKNFKSREVKDRIVGRNEYYHNLRFKSACDEFTNGVDSGSDTSVGTEYVRRKHKHRHRRKKRSTKFGYDIKDLDSFLSEATIDRPGNIPVVMAFPTVLYQTQKECQQELPLPLGTVVNAVFKNQQWVYAQTPHGDEGYVLYSACLPLGILPNRTSVQKKTPCWESSTDIYPRPCGNLTDTEKEQLRGRTRSESRYRPRNERRYKTSCAEKDFDSLYLKTKSVCSNIDKVHEKENFRNIKTVKRQTLLVVNSDYTGSALNNTLSVNKGDVVVLVQGGGVETDVDSEWFYVRKRDGSQGFIPAAIAGHGYI